MCGAMLGAEPLRDVQGVRGQRPCARREGGVNEGPFVLEAVIVGMLAARAVTHIDEAWGLGESHTASILARHAASIALDATQREL